MTTAGRYGLGVQAGRVSMLARYPVKSMRGEALAAAEVDERGLRGDRAWAVCTADGGIGSGKTTRRFRRLDGLLRYRATLVDGPTPLVIFPSGAAHRAGDAVVDQSLSAALEQPAELRSETTISYHDESPVHLVTTAALRHLGDLLGSSIDAGRLRANVVLETGAGLEGFVEDDRVGRDLALGDSVVLTLGPGMPRCVMVDLPQPGHSGQPRVLREPARVHGLELGLQAGVRRSGVVRHGDVAQLL